MAYDSDFGWNITRDNERTVINLTRMNLIPATYMLYLLRNKMRWTHRENFKLEWTGTGTNREIEIQIIIPKPKDSKSTRDPFTEEWCSGYFSGIIESIKDKTNEELLLLCNKLA